MEIVFRMRLKELASCVESEARRELESKGRVEYDPFSYLDWKRFFIKPDKHQVLVCCGERESSHPV